MNEQKTEFVIEKGKFIRRDIVESVVAADEDILKRLADSSYRMALVESLDKLPIYLAMYKDSNVSSIKVDKLMFNTLFSITDDYVYPSFGSIGRSETEMRKEWVVPDEINLFFSCAFGQDIKKPTCYLTAIEKKSAKTLLGLPLPNIHDNGNICMGDQRVSKSTDIVGQTIYQYNTFYTSPWNRDLLRGDGHKEFFKWDKNDKQLPIPKNWTDYCRKISVNNMNHLYSI